MTDKTIAEDFVDVVEAEARPNPAEKLSGAVADVKSAHKTRMQATKRKKELEAQLKAAIAAEAKAVEAFRASQRALTQATQEDDA